MTFGAVFKRRAMSHLPAPYYRTWGFVACMLVGSATAHAQLTTPREFFGHEIGADYVLPNYRQLAEYWRVLERQSDRMKMVDIGETSEGRRQYMAIVTAPANHANLERYREISGRLARAEGLSDEEARGFAREGKAVVWIDGGLHASEVLGAQQLMETVWQMVSGTDDETLSILDEVIILFVHANPDGHDLVSDWYMRIQEPTERSMAGLPRLYQKYVGHDNNRDSFASTQVETENMNRVLYHEWYPQIMYNHHQTGPPGTVMFAPPFRDPFNYNFDPLVITGIDLVGSAMHNRFVTEDKPGVVRRRGANYSTWWNGGLRTTVYFHNMIGLLTETIGGPNPMDIPFVAERVLPSDNQPYPIPPQTWHFRQSVDYSVTANKAVMDVAARHREQFLYNIYQMGRNSIERGSRDSWTIWPKQVDAVKEALNQFSGMPDFAAAMGGFGGMPMPASEYERLRGPDDRDPRAFVIPADQADFPTATRFVNALLENGVTVHRATAEFSVAGKRYPANSYVVLAAQAFRPHVMDMFEPQDHPNDFAYPGGPPTPPYDAAGWTLAFQMGVEFDRILEGIDGPFERIDEWNVSPPAGTVTGGSGVAGYLLSHRVNDTFRIINQLHARDIDVFWMTGSRGTVDAGTFYVPAGRGFARLANELAAEFGVDFTGVASQPPGRMLRLGKPRIALADEYGGSMPSGWIRWVLEQWEYTGFDVVYPPDLDAGNLRDDYDVIILPDGIVREGSMFARFFGGMPDSTVQKIVASPMFQRMMAQYGMSPPDPNTVPEEWRLRMGETSDEKTVPQLRRFLEDGGTVLAIGSSTILGSKLGLPVEDAVVKVGEDGSEESLGREEYYLPGSVLRSHVDDASLIAHGIPDQVDVFFDNSPVFKLGDNAASMGVRTVAWFDSPEPLRSGWAWGQHHLEGAAAVVSADVGDGHLYLFGPEIAFRAQPHGTFKFLFNGIALSNAEEESPR